MNFIMMKKIRIIILLTFTCIFFISCKNETKKNNHSEIVNFKENFSVDFDVVAEKADDFTVYYTETGTNEFIGDDAVWRGVYGGGLEEKVVIDLPKKIVPTNIRLDFGVKPDRKDVLLKNLKFSYYDKSFEIIGSDFFKYFVVREGVKTEIDTIKKTIKFIKTPNQVVGTNYYPTQNLLDNISKITH